MSLNAIIVETLNGKRSFEELVRYTLHDARRQHPGSMASGHEGLAVILEEYKEFEIEVFKKNRDNIKVLEELSSIAAMCQRFSEDVLKTKSNIKLTREELERKKRV
jgi:hypothetical protein